MPRRKKPNDYGTGTPYHEVKALARVLLPEIQAFFESEDGQREYAEWKAKQQAGRERIRHNRGGNILTDAPALLSALNFQNS